MSTAPAAASSSPSARDVRRVAFASAMGTTIEWYDFFIYGTAAATVFGAQFFPQVSDLAGRMAAFATFAVGFIARPLGGVVMGHYGDRLGRKFTLVWSLLLMGLSTSAIGVLPTYATIGAWAPALLVSLRFVQGFALGGEWGGAVLMSVEHAPAAKRGLFGSFVALGLPAGIVLSNLVFMVTSLAVTPEAFAAWAWRVPFLASALLVVLGLFIRLGIAESPVFLAGATGARQAAMPLVEVLRTHTRMVLLAAASYIGISTLGFIVLVYFVAYATRRFGVPLPTALALVVLSAIVFAISIVVMAAQSDRLGRRRVMRWGLSGILLWSLVFFPLIDTGSVPLMALALCGMLGLQGAYIGPQPAVFSELFPTNVRYSGASLSLTLATLLGGAIAPAIATSLYELAGGSWAVTAYMVATAALSLAASYGLPETYRDSLEPAADQR